LSIKFTHNDYTINVSTNYEPFKHNSLSWGISFSVDAMHHKDVSTAVALATEDHRADMTSGGPQMYRHVMVQGVTVLETFSTDLTPMNQFPFLLGSGPKFMSQRQEGRCLATGHA
jgi:hypothetical protein